MNHRRLISMLGVIALMALSLQKTDAQGKWTNDRAIAWRAKVGWLVGCNFTPSNAINQLEMWQADTFDTVTIDRELGWAQKLGFNSVRVFLHNLLWQQDSRAFVKRVDMFLKIADSHHIGVMFVLLDSCWDPYPKLGKQREPRQGLHNSGWVQAPGKEIISNPARYDELKPYVMGMLKRFGKDHRVHFWDLINEPDNNNGSSYGKEEPADKANLALQLLTKVFEWAREAGPSQPVSAGVWLGDWSSEAKLSPVNKFMLDNSDVITFHNYGDKQDMATRIGWLKRYNRPLLCTEYMARPMKSTFENILPMMKEQGIAAYNWGFVDGKTQTIYPWDSWQKPYAAEPPVWFHDILRRDGTAYRAEEVKLIRELMGVNGK